MWLYILSAAYLYLLAISLLTFSCSLILYQFYLLATVVPNRCPTLHSRSCASCLMAPATTRYSTQRAPLHPPYVPSTRYVHLPNVYRHVNAVKRPEHVITRIFLYHYSLSLQTENCWGHLDTASHWIYPLLYCIL